MIIFHPPDNDHSSDDVNLTTADVFTLDFLTY